MQRILLLLFCLFPALAGAVDHYNLARVVVTGSQRYQQDDLLRATGLVLNTQVTTDDLQNAANRLGTSGAFSSVQFLFKPATGAKGVEADFQVADSGNFLAAIFENFVWFSPGELQQAIHQTVPLYNGRLPASGSLCDDVSAALTKLLTAKGLPSQISYLLSGDFGQAPSAYKFRIEDADLKISDVTLLHAEHILPEQLAKAVAPLKNMAYLYSDVAKVLEKNLIPAYTERGYLKFTIGEISPRLEAKDLVRVEVTVNEGDQFKLAGYNWAGNTLIPSDELSKKITLKPGLPVDAQELERNLVEIRKLYGKFGREEAAITPEPVFEGRAVTYNFQVKEGELYHMGKLEIEGVEPAQARKLAQGWKLAEGEPYDSTYIQQFLAHTVVKVASKHWEWKMIEQVDTAKKAVNVKLQLKIE